MHLLQRLIDRHRADRDGCVADDPFTRGVNVAASGKIHDRIGAPTDRPNHLLDFLLHRGGDRRIADVRVDLGEEVTSNDHRLQFGVIDVGRNDRASARDFRAHEFRRDEWGHASVEALAVGERCLRPFEHLLAAEILAFGDIDHLLGEDAGARPFQLRDTGRRACSLPPCGGGLGRGVAR